MLPGPLLLAAALCPCVFAASAAPAPNAVDIVRKSVQTDLLDYERLKDYTYTEHDEDRSYDRHGQLKKTETETYDVLILGGEDYEKLIARDGRPLSAKDARKEQAKMDREVARRESESPEEKARIEKQRREQRRFLDEVPGEFLFTLLGEEDVSGKPAWKISAEPKPGYHPRDRLAKLIAGMRGTIWIDKGEYQWVRIETQATRPLSFGLGLLKIEPGATIKFEQTRVNDEVWLPSSASIRLDARVALFDHLRHEVEMRFQNYQKFQADSTFTPESAAP